jgi:hypothetical protein
VQWLRRFVDDSDGSTVALCGDVRPAEDMLGRRGRLVASASPQVSQSVLTAGEDETSSRWSMW